MLRLFHADRFPDRAEMRAKGHRYADHVSTEHENALDNHLARRPPGGARAEFDGFSGAGSVGARSGISGAASRVLTEIGLHAA
jgi:hypothetical protein